jgi:Flp pilus assembly protein TadD
MKSRSGAPKRKASIPAMRQGAWWRAGLVVIAGAAVYANSLSNPFVLDDGFSVVNNASIRIWPSTGAFSTVPETPTAGRPLVNASMAINYAIGALDPVGYHVWNLAMHLGCALLLFLCALVTAKLDAMPDWIRSRAPDVALAVALLWMLHPINSEVVDYVTERSESMMAAAYLLTIYASTRALSSRRIAWQSLAVTACAIGMGCKESMVTAPIAVVLYDATLAFGSWKRALAERWRFYLALGSTWLILGALLQAGARRYSAGLSTNVSSWAYLLNQTVMIVRYLRLAIWPNALVVNYGWPRTLTLAEVLPYALVVVALGLATLFALWRQPAAGFFGAWFFLTLAPTSSILPIATEVGAERRMYLPLAALVALVVAGLARLEAGSKWPRWTAPAVVVSLAATLAAVSIARNREYQSPLLLAEVTLARWPTPSAESVLGQELAIAGRHDEAIAVLRKAAPDYPRANYPLGGELFNQGKLDDAIPALQEFVRAEPSLVEVVDARTMLGRAFMVKRQFPEAIDQLRLVLSMTGSHDAKHTTALGFVADSLFAQQKFDEARDAYVSYLATRPDDTGAMTNLGVSLSATGRADDAVRVFRRVVELMPNDPAARRNLAIALEDQKR